MWVYKQGICLGKQRKARKEPVSALRSELETFRTRSKSDKYWGETSGGLN
jgi:hypothetical protein